MRLPKYLAVPLLAALLVTGCTSTSKVASPPPRSPSASPSAVASSSPAFARLEHRYKARLGVYAIDTGTGRTVTYRADERFAFASTAKALTAGLLLRRDTDAQLNHVITYKSSDLQDYAPVTSKHVRTGMSLRAVIAAALQYSDNTAANLMLAQLGGPHAVQTDLRGLGDSMTQVDRTEPTLNTAVPGDTRDTTTPRAIATDLRDFTLGNDLTAARRQVLTGLMRGNTTGGPYIRAGVPSGWTVGDKTGNGDYGTRNDIAVVWPAGGGAPIVIALLSDRGKPNASSDDALLADATKATITALT